MEIGTKCGGHSTRPCACLDATRTVKHSPPLFPLRNENFKGHWQLACGEVVNGYSTYVHERCEPLNLAEREDRKVMMRGPLSFPRVSISPDWVIHARTIVS
jgi:hypothetical protein